MACRDLLTMEEEWQRHSNPFWDEQGEYKLRKVLALLG